MSEKKTRENYTRVTTVLYPFSGLEKINPEIVARAADRGTRVHKICEGIVSGFGEIGVDDVTAPYVESFKKWFSEDPKILLMEKRFWDDDLEITGQVDFITETPTGLAVVDLKTSSRPSKTWPAQGCAYAHLAKKDGYDIKHILFIHLNKMGNYPKLYSYDVDPGFFLDCLRVWKHFFK